MSSTQEASSIQGACNCGAIAVTVPKDQWPKSSMVCHCLNCRASGGSLYVWVFSFGTAIFLGLNRIVLVIVLGWFYVGFGLEVEVRVAKLWKRMRVVFLLGLCFGVRDHCSCTFLCCQ